MRLVSYIWAIEIDAKPIFHSVFVWLFAACSVYLLQRLVVFSALGCLFSTTQRLSKSYGNVPEDMKRDSKHFTSATAYAHGSDIY